MEAVPNLDDPPQDPDAYHFNTYYLTLSQDVFARVARLAQRKHVNISQMFQALVEFALACEAMGELSRREVTSDLERVLTRLIQKGGEGQ